MNRHRPLAWWSAVLALALATGCATPRLFTRAAPAEDVEFARAYLALFPARAYAAIEMGMDPSIKTPEIRQKVMLMASIVPPGEPTSVTVVRSLSISSGNDTTSSLTFQYQYPDRWIAADVDVYRHNHAPVIKHVQFRPLRSSLDQINRFTFAGKSPMHGVALAVALLMFGFVLWTFTLAVRSPAPGMKWAWAAFVLVGIVRFTFNWSTGALTIAPMSVQLFGATFSKASAFDPLFLTTSLPVGAIVYLVQRREWRQDGMIPPPPVPPQS